MQLLVKGSTNGTITGTEIARAQVDAGLDLKQMKPVLTTLEAHDIEIVVDAPHASTTKKTRTGTKGGTVATARNSTAAATKSATRTTTATATDGDEDRRQEDHRQEGSRPTPASPRRQPRSRSPKKTAREEDRGEEGHDVGRRRCRRR